MFPAKPFCTLNVAVDPLYAYSTINWNEESLDEFEEFNPNTLPDCIAGAFKKNSIVYDWAECAKSPLFVTASAWLDPLNDAAYAASTIVITLLVATIVPPSLVRTVAVNVSSPSNKASLAIVFVNDPVLPLIVYEPVNVLSVKSLLVIFVPLIP